MQFKTDATGGYVAENHRAYMQLAPWTLRWINQYKDERGRKWIQDLNIKHFNKWSRKDKFAYLHLRGIYPNSQSLKSELFEMAKASRDIQAKHTFEPFSGTDMRQMVLVLNFFLSALFSMDITGEKARNRLSATARMYLCC